MSKSITKAKEASKIMRNRQETLVQRPQQLSEIQYAGMLVKFYKEAEESGFYCTKERAYKKKGYYFLEPQRRIAESILRSVFKRTRYEIYVSLTRQIGKTQIISLVTEFCFRHYQSVFGKPLAVAIVAPERGTAKEVFDRVKNYIIQNETDLMVDTNVEVKTLSGDTIRLYGIYQSATGGTIEGRTFDMTIRDEAHLGDDGKYADEVLPATNRTSGPNIMIGNAGFSDCMYYRGLMKGTDASPKVHRYVFRYTYKTLRPYMTSLANDAQYPNHDAALFVKNTDRYIENM